MKTSKAILLVALLFTLSGIYANTQTIAIQVFKSLEISGYLNVTLVQSTTNKLSIKASKNLQKSIKITETNGNLCITQDHKAYRRIAITITFTSLSEIDSKIDGKLFTAGIIKVQDLSLNIANNGKTKLNLAANSLEADFRGKENIYLSGAAKKVNFNTKVIGLLDASTFIIDTLNVNNSGKGDVRVFVTDYVSANHIGDGTLSIDGRPDIDYCPLSISYRKE